MEEEIRRRVTKTEEILKGIDENNVDYEKYLAVLDIYREDNEKIKRKKKAKETARRIIEIIETKVSTTSEKLKDYMRNAYDTLARNGDFEAFMIAMEWNRPIKSQFYLPRRRVLREHGFIQGIQDLLDRKIKTLVIEAPPGIGKSVMGEFAFCYQYVMNPESKSLMGGNANMLVTGFYQDILDFLSSSEYRFKEIFPDFPDIISSSEYKMIYTERKKREPNLMFVSIEVRSDRNNTCRWYVVCRRFNKDSGASEQPRPMSEDKVCIYRYVTRPFSKC